MRNSMSNSSMAFDWKLDLQRRKVYSDFCSNFGKSFVDNCRPDGPDWDSKKLSSLLATRPISRPSLWCGYRCLKTLLISRMFANRGSESWYWDCIVESLLLAVDIQEHRDILYNIKIKVLWKKNIYEECTYVWFLI